MGEAVDEHVDAAKLTGSILNRAFDQGAAGDISGKKVGCCAAFAEAAGKGFALGGAAGADGEAGAPGSKLFADGDPGGSEGAEHERVLSSQVHASHPGGQAWPAVLPASPKTALATPRPSIAAGNPA